MAEAVVSFLVGKIGAILEEEMNLLGGVRGDVAYVRDELQHMATFLRAAEVMEEPNPQVTVWVNQVRDIAFDIEDVLDEFMLRLARDGRGRGRFLGCFTSSFCFDFNVKYRHQFASKIREIKPRIINVSESYKRYELGTQLDQDSTSASSNLWHEHRGDALLLEGSELVGIDTPKEKLIEWLIDGEPMTKVISVEGMGGLGKTTLVKQVYDDARVKKHFDCHVWVTVSQLFKLEELLREIINKIYKEIMQPAPQEMETMSSNELKGIIKEFLKHRRHLLVFDDVWLEEAWDSIKNALPQNSQYSDGSRVILTTRLAQVSLASQVDFKGEVLHLDALSLQDSWTLFCKKTFHGHQCPSHLASTCEQIVERCKGLPLAIVAIGGLLATKDQSRVNEWERVRRNLSGELGSNKLVSLKKILLLSYYDLPFYLRACALYLATFPEDYEIQTKRLIRLWIAERFVIEKEGWTLEEVGESYLNELISRSLVEVAFKDKDETDTIRACRVHDILREVIFSKAKQQNFVAISTNEQNKRELVVHDQKVRRLSIHCNEISENYEIVNSLSGLRSILMFGVEDVAFTSDILISLGRDSRLLTVLDLRGTKLDIFPVGIVKLYHLRYLSLRETNVAKIPTSIEKLQNLETLNLKGTFVTRLPHTIINLQHLRHLIVCRDEEYQSEDGSIRSNIWGFAAVCGIGTLLSLHELCTISVNSKNGSVVIGELGKLKQLRKLRILGLRAEDGMALCSSLEKLSNICSLHIVSCNEGILDLKNMNSPPRSLQRLRLTGRLDMVPRWITCLQNLRKLALAGSGLKEDGTNVLESIQGLPNLMQLVLGGFFEGERLNFKGEGFQKLKSLVLWGMPHLQSIEVELGSMPHLNWLGITNCELLEKVPFGIEHLFELQSLLLGYVSENLINSIDQTKGGQDYSRVKHILEVLIANFEDGEWIGRRL